MKLDTVHDIQKTFRNIVEINTFPGRVLNIRKESEKIDLELPLSKDIMLICLTLLDREVKFFSSKKDIAATICGLTYSLNSSLKDAEFIIHNSNDDMEFLFKNANIGNFIDPHTGATVIIEVDEIETEQGFWTLEGPGIKEFSNLKVSASFNILKPREVTNVEFPLGLDLILVDKLGNMVALPRTTKITGGR